MTFSDFNTWARLGFRGDDGKEICNYMGQHEDGCNCEQSTSNWVSYHSSRWDDGATPASCLCLLLHLLLSSLPGSHPRDSLDRNLSSRHRW